MTSIFEKYKNKKLNLICSYLNKLNVSKEVKLNVINFYIENGFDYVENNYNEDKSFYTFHYKETKKKLRLLLEQSNIEIAHNKLCYYLNKIITKPNFTRPSDSNVYQRKGTDNTKQDVLRAELFNICYMCGNQFSPKLLTIDHIIPKAKNGTNHYVNLAIACEKCNSIKNNKDVYTFHKNAYNAFNEYVREYSNLETLHPLVFCKQHLFGLLFNGKYNAAIKFIKDVVKTSDINPHLLNEIKF